MRFSEKAFAFFKGHIKQSFFHIQNYVNYSLYFILFPGHYQDCQQVENSPSNQQDCY